MLFIDSGDIGPLRDMAVVVVVVKEKDEGGEGVSRNWRCDQARVRMRRRTVKDGGLVKTRRRRRCLPRGGRSGRWRARVVSEERVA